MRLDFRETRRGDVAAVVALLSDDVLGQGREGSDLAPYLAAFERMAGEAANVLIVGEDAGGAIVASYQVSFISGLSLGAARRAQVESVRVASHLRGQGGASDVQGRRGAGASGRLPSNSTDYERRAQG